MSSRTRDENDRDATEKANGLHKIYEITGNNIKYKEKEKNSI